MLGLLELCSDVWPVQMTTYRPLGSHVVALAHRRPTTFLLGVGLTGWFSPSIKPLKLKPGQPQPLSSMFTSSFVKAEDGPIVGDR